MKSFGVIAEFNPLHNGHNYIIDTAKSLGATHLTVALSGNFVQRGETAIISKFKRAEMAIKCGADLVVELPLPYSIATANRFAFAGVNILQHFCDNLIFGSECGELEKFSTAIALLKTDEFKDKLDKHLKKGISFAAARYNAIKDLDKSVAEIFNTPNDTLGLEYILEAEKIEKSFNFHPIKRVGADHSGKIKTNKFCSASYIRNNIKHAKKFMPISAYNILKNEIKCGKIADYKNLENAILSHLKRFDAKDFLSFADVNEGLENRIKKAVDSSTTLDELFDSIKTKRYAHSRIRRIILSSFLGIEKSLYDEDIPYVRVLAFNKKGEELIKMAKNNGINIVSSLKAVEDTSVIAKKFAQLEYNAGKIYGLAYNKKEDFNEYKYKVYKES